MPGMTETDLVILAPEAAGILGARESNRDLLGQVLRLALPVLAEQVLHMMVGLNDTWLANHLPHDAADAGAAVGTITYFLWFIGLLVASVGTGSTAIIARAKGARHRSLANRVTGQSISAALLMGALIGLATLVNSRAIVHAAQLQGLAQQFALSYLRMLSLTLPLTMLMLMAGACLRGGGDTITPAAIMVMVDIVNMVSSFALTRGWFGLPALGFKGIALGTILAYVVGGVTQFIVLCIGTRGAKLHLHRMWPHWHTIKRLLRIGVPTGVGGMLDWFANFGVLSVVNHMDSTNVSSAAHMNTIRLESISFLSGIAFATAAATMVGISLGRKDPDRAQRCAYLSYAVGGSIMFICGLLMITLGRFPARWLSPHDPHIIALTTHCLFITGFIQSGFAANLIFGFALRGAGDTLVITLLNLSTIIGIRFLGVLIVGLWLHLGLQAVWMVLAGELFIRGCITYGRFIQGAWMKIQV
jgi:putative MATE family efflux protein